MWGFEALNTNAKWAAKRKSLILGAPKGHHAVENVGIVKCNDIWFRRQTDGRLYLVLIEIYYNIQSFPDLNFRTES